MIKRSVGGLARNFGMECQDINKRDTVEKLSSITEIC